VLKCIIHIYWITYLDAKLIYYKKLHINTTYNFNINLVYVTCEHQNQRLITPKLATINWVLPKNPHHA
jgi:hypothetical protein